MEDKQRISTTESVIYRETAHADGSLMVYLELPEEERETGKILLKGIGYWGQANSFATCLTVQESPPMASECAQPLRTVSEQMRLHSFFSCILSEFRDASVLWQEVVAYDELPKERMRNPLKLEIYVWPLQIARQSHQGFLCPITASRGDANEYRCVASRKAKFGRTKHVHYIYNRFISMIRHKCLVR